jgi:hypothetical protein
MDYSSSIYFILYLLQADAHIQAKARIKGAESFGFIKYLRREFQIEENV